MIDDGLLSLTVASLARAIARRDVSAEQVVQAHLDRLHILNPQLNTILQIAPESALRQAREADAALAADLQTGPLHGVPFTVKDVYPVTHSAELIGAPGMPEPLDLASEGEAAVVTRLHEAGAILIGVTRATLWDDREQRYGPAHNPYDLACTPGGSSGGEAATIAAGGSPLGMGSDSGGSLRMPAHFCGIATLRPSNGRVPRGIDAAGTNDPRTVAGPLARSIEDLDLVMRVASGPHPADPTTLPIPWPDYRLLDLQSIRVGLFTDNGIVKPTPETVAATLFAGAELEDSGAVVEEVCPPAMEEAWEITRKYWHYCGETGAVAEYFAFLDRWDRYRSLMSRFMANYDILVCPVESGPAGLIGASETSPGFTYTTPFSLLGWPCAVVRAGTSPEGLPIGVQVVAGPWRDDLALAGAACVEADSGGWRITRLKV